MGDQKVLKIGLLTNKLHAADTISAHQHHIHELELCTDKTGFS
jgi:hypothetical protein